VREPILMTDAVARLRAVLADRYRFELERGQVGMATVHLAHDLRHDRKVAAKVPRPEVAVVLGAERFLAEIRTTASLQHPDIPALFDSGESEGLLYRCLAQNPPVHPAGGHGPQGLYRMSIARIAFIALAIDAVSLLLPRTAMTSPGNTATTAKRQLEAPARLQTRFPSLFAPADENLAAGTNQDDQELRDSRQGPPRGDPQTLPCVIS
jgi:hypothetical protein